ncbi:hypothetical protein AQUCO_06500025v1, partial [Aquilegia coerulea]
LYVLTTPLYYVNAPPHMGSAYTTIAADAIARFQRLLGKKVIFITGTDEHGEKIAAAATACGSSPREHCDNISHAYKMLWKDLDIAYDKFIRTTDSSHETIVKEFYSRVLANGDIYRANYEGLYCVNCEEYKLPYPPKPCVARKEDNYFFALSKYQKSLEDVLIKNPDFVQPSSRLNEVQGWIKSGLRDFSISRALVDWGIPVPNDEKQTIYVWFDALLGYISALSPEEKQRALQYAVSSGWPASLHLIGKDILRFHAVYWPAMLMSAGLSLPKKLFGHGFLTKDGMKMGKSLGNTLEPKDLVHRFGSDAVRYFFLREVEFGSDGDYSEDRFINIVNAHLANTIVKKDRLKLMACSLGVMVIVVSRNHRSTYRAIQSSSFQFVIPLFISQFSQIWEFRNCQSTLIVDSTVAAEGIPLKDNVEILVEKARNHYEKLSLSSACEAVLEIGNAGNLYMDERAPWSLFKQGGAASEAAAKDLVIILETMRIIAVALSPIAPNLCLKIYAQLGYSQDQFDTITWRETRWGGLKAGQVMAQAQPIFARIEHTTEGEEGGEAKKVVKDKRIPKIQVAAEA